MNSMELSRHRLMRHALIALLPVLAGCSAPGLTHSDGRHINLPASATASIPAPVATLPTLAQPKANPRTETYSVVVNNLPVSDLLFALGRDAKINIDIHPGVEGNITLSAINQTLPQILERLAKQVDIRWDLHDNTLNVAPDTPYLNIYQIDYFGLNKSVSSKIAISNNVGSSNASDNSSSTTVQTESQNRFWPQLEAGLCKQVVSYKESRSEVLRLLTLDKQQKKENEAKEKKKLKEQEYLADLHEMAARKGITITELLWERDRDNKKSTLELAKTLAPNTKNYTAEVIDATRTAPASNPVNTNEPTDRPSAEIKDLNATSCGFGTESGNGNGQTGNAVSINPETGVVVVNGPKKLHQLVSDYLANVQSSALRQVMIEATVVEVTLSDQYQAGVDWAGVTKSGNWGAGQSITNSKIDPIGPIGLVSYTSGMFNATLTYLEQFGKTKVLSSPKIMALNNQTAVMKVVDEQVYFGLKLQITRNEAGYVTDRTYTSELHTVPVGLVMQVTPQIAESGVITLNVRPTITRIRDYVEDPAFAVIVSSDTQKIKSLIPNLQIREFDSTLKIPSGQVAVLGGLIQDVQSNERSGIPVLSRLPWIGDLFSYRNDIVKKIELVIFLRPIAIKAGGLEGEMSNFQQFAPGKNFFDPNKDDRISAFQSGNLPNPLGKDSK